MALIYFALISFLSFLKISSIPIHGKDNNSIRDVMYTHLPLSFSMRFIVCFGKLLYFASVFVPNAVNNEKDHCVRFAYIFLYLRVIFVIGLLPTQMEGVASFAIKYATNSVQLKPHL